MTLGRIGTFLTMITNAAIDMPTDWIINPNVRASSGAMLSTLVKTGNAIAAPPSAVAPATNDPIVIVREMGQKSANRPHESEPVI